MTSALPPRPAHPQLQVHPDHDRGLEFDVRTLVARRSALGLLGGAGLAALAGCTDGSPGTAVGSSAATTGSTTSPVSPSGTTTGTASGTPAVDTQVPAETAGPFPGGGSNGQDVLDDTGIVRKDLRSSIGTSTT